jgi:hypothetical protein
MFSALPPTTDIRRHVRVVPNGDIDVRPTGRSWREAVVRGLGRFGGGRFAVTRRCNKQHDGHLSETPAFNDDLGTTLKRRREGLTLSEC